MSIAPAQNDPAPSRVRSPLVELLLVAVPVAATMLSHTIAQFVDAAMVAQLGPGELAAQGNGGVLAWLMISIFIGGATVINTYVSQNLGAGRPERGPAYPWNGIWLGLIYWFALLLPMGLFAEPLWRAVLAISGQHVG
ncbi:MAG: MATE family efflux transporter, partial [Planctomycetota bacterium]|nr:MATE family efflux transporter [Planctomycetota bacterium]